MNSHYNRVAGQSLERIAALSDGIFAVAMTLLVLDLRVPVLHAAHTEQALWDALRELAPRLLPYVMGFLTLGIFWLAQQAQLNAFKHSDRTLTWLHIAFLLAVSLMPFSTSLLAEFIHFRLALLVYWANLVLLGFMLLASWRYALRSELVKDEVPPELRHGMVQRILTYQALYALGAVLGVVNTFLGIGFIALLQLISAIGPRHRWLNKL